MVLRGCQGVAQVPVRLKFQTSAATGDVSESCDASTESPIGAVGLFYYPDLLVVKASLMDSELDGQ